MQFSVRRGSSGWAALARLTGRAFALATLAGVAVLLFSGTAAAETCKRGCEDASDTASRNLVQSSLGAVNSLVQHPARQILGQGRGATATTASEDSTPVPAKQTVPAAAAEDTTSDLAEQATEAIPTSAASAAPTSSASSPGSAASTPSLDAVEPIVSTVTDTVETVVPVAETSAAAPASDLLIGQPLQGIVDTTTDAIAELGAAVPAVASTVQTLDATTQQLLTTADATTTALLDSAQQVVTTATTTLQPVTESVTGALATALGGPAGAGSAPAAPSTTHAEPGSGAQQLGAATLGDTLPVTGFALANPWADLAGHPASADGQVPTPPPEQASDATSASDGDQNALVLTGHQAAAVPATSGAGAANGGGTASPSAPDLGKLFFDLSPAAPQPGFLPALHHSAYVPSAPVVEPAQSPD